MPAADARETSKDCNPFDRRHEAGRFDIVGDVHGCAEELRELTEALGYHITLQEGGGASVEAPRDRRCVFVGDLTDRGPNTPDVLRLVMALVQSGHGLAVPGNHDVKFVRWLEGRNVRLAHGLERTAEQFQSESPLFREQVLAFYAELPDYLWLDGGTLAVAHAGLKEDMIGRQSGAIRSFCLYGETSGEKDDFGLPVRYHWAAEYKGKTAVIYGHTPVPDPEWVNNTLCIDTGCCFGGKLTAMRWPEREIVSVTARETYAPSRRPFGHPPVRPGVEI